MGVKPNGKEPLKSKPKCCFVSMPDQLIFSAKRYKKNNIFMNKINIPIVLISFNFEHALYSKFQNIIKHQCQLIYRLKPAAKAAPVAI